MRRRYLAFGLSWLVVSFFLNCSAEHNNYSSVSMPLDHGGPAGELTVESRVPLGDRLYIESVLREIFYDADSAPHFNGTLYDELRTSQHLFGRPCSPYETGDLDDCQHAIANANFAMHATSSSAREATRLQICRWYTAADKTLLAAVRKTGAPENQPPDEAASAAVVRLFYPEIEESVVAETAVALRALDAAAAGESAIHRWRLQFLAVCESPGWEML